MTEPAARARLTVLPGSAGDPVERLLLATGSLFVCRIDRAGRIVEANDAFETFAGRSLEDVPLVDLVEPSFVAAVEAALADPDDPAVATRAALLAPDGAAREVLVRVLPRAVTSLVVVEAPADRRTAAAPDRIASIAVVDVDRLDSINERYGRDVGEGILASLARTLDACARGSDLIERSPDGRRFVVTLERCRLDDAIVWAERIRARLRAFRDLGSGEAVTVTIGVAELRRDEEADAARARADAALRLARSEGWDRVRAAR